MAQPTTCPNRDLLARLASGQLSGGERSSVEQHLSSCSTCVEVLRTLRPGDPQFQTLDSDNAQLGGDRTAAVDVSAELARADAAASPSFLAPAQRPDEIGRLANYRVLKKLGAGGMGMVFLAEDTHLDRPVALKVMLPAAAAAQGAGQRFLREAKLTAAIKNDHIVTIYQVGQHGDVPFLAMELLKGAMLE